MPRGAYRDKYLAYRVIDGPKLHEVGVCAFPRPMPVSLRNKVRRVDGCEPSEFIHCLCGKVFGGVELEKLFSDGIQHSPVEPDFQCTARAIRWLIVV